MKQLMMGVVSFTASIKDGTATAQGNTDILAWIASTLVIIDSEFDASLIRSRLPA